MIVFAKCVGDIMALLQSNQEALAHGAQAPAFTLKNARTGEIVSLGDFQGKPVVIIFMCNHCPYVIPKMDDIKKLQEDFKEKGIVVICINSNNNPAYEEDNFENTQRIAEEKGYDYYLFDETQEVAKVYGAVCTPDPYVFDQDHKLAYHGRINDDLGTSNNPSTHDLRDVLDRLTHGKDIEEWFKPSQGCSIKWN